MQHVLLFTIVIVLTNAQSPVKSLFTNGRIQGEATFYGAGADSGGTCMYNNPRDALGTDLITVAIGDFGNAEKCGMCVKIYPSGTGAGSSDFPQRQPFVAYVNNQCPECGPNNLDIAQGSDGRWNMEWEPVECPVNGNILVQLKTGSSVWHTEISARNFKVPLDKFEYQINGGWTQLARQPYNYFKLSGDINGKLPITARLTSVFGEQVTFTINDYNTIEPGLIDTGVQFTTTATGRSQNPPSNPPPSNPPPSNPPPSNPPPSNPPSTPPSDSGSCEYADGKGDNDYWIEVVGSESDTVSVTCSNGRTISCEFQWGKHTCAPDGFPCEKPRKATKNRAHCSFANPKAAAVASDSANFSEPKSETPFSLPPYAVALIAVGSVFLIVIVVFAVALISNKKKPEHV